MVLNNDQYNTDGRYFAPRSTKWIQIGPVVLKEVLNRVLGENRPSRRERAVGNNLERKKEITAVKIIFYSDRKRKSFELSYPYPEHIIRSDIVEDRLRYVQSSQRTVHWLIDDGTIIQLEPVWMSGCCCCCRFLLFLLWMATVSTNRFGKALKSQIIRNDQEFVKYFCPSKGMNDTPSVSSPYINEKQRETHGLK